MRADASGLTSSGTSGCLSSGTKEAAPGSPPVALLINSSKLRAVFGVEEFKEIVAPSLDLPVASRTRGGSGAGVRELDGEPNRFVLRPSADERARDACVAAGAQL